MAFPPHFPERTVGLYCLVRYCRQTGLRGDIVECGVGRGVSFFLIGSFMHCLDYPARLYGFDSFQGFPEPSPLDDSPRKPKQGEWGDTSVAHVKNHFQERGLEGFFQQRCVLIEGFFESTVLKDDLPLKSISLLHLDVDLYESYLICGRKLGPLVEERGIILYDEYDQENWPGATIAINETLDLIGHRLFYSALMDKYFSLDKDSWPTADKPLMELMDLLQARPSEKAWPPGANPISREVDGDVSDSLNWIRMVVTK